MATDYRTGDYRVVAKRLRPAAAHLVALCSPAAGDLVVDVAAGSGNVARLCTARGASAVAVDREPAQLRLGRDDPDPDIAWVCGDALAMPVRSGIAGAALSTFGLIYVPDPVAAVAELARVCRPGGTVGLTAWTDDGYQAGFTALICAATGEQAAHDHLTAWGTVERLATRLSAVADDVRVEVGELVEHSASVDVWWATRELSPPIASARAQLSAQEFAEFGEQMRAMAREVGSLTADGFSISNGYLAGVARVR